MDNGLNSLSELSDMTWKQARALLHGLFEMLPDGVVLIDPHESNYVIVDCNATYAKMNGYTVQELVGQTATLLLGTDSYPASVIAADHNLPFAHTDLPFVERMRQVGVLRSRIIHRRKDGSLFPIEFRASLITIGGREFILGLDRDVSSQEHFENIRPLAKVKIASKRVKATGCHFERSREILSFHLAKRFLHSAALRSK